MTPVSLTRLLRHLQGRKLVFVVTEDWFFASHFLPMAQGRAGARARGRASSRGCATHRDAIEAAGAKVIPLEAERRSLNPMAAGYAAGHLAAILKERRPDIVHCIALRASSSAASRPAWPGSGAASMR